MAKSYNIDIRNDPSNPDYTWSSNNGSVFGSDSNAVSDCNGNSTNGYYRTAGPIPIPAGTFIGVNILDVQVNAPMPLLYSYDLSANPGFVMVNTTTLSQGCPYADNLITAVLLYRN
jgi:hypothetical protein